MTHERKEKVPGFSNHETTNHFYGKIDQLTIETAKKKSINNIKDDDQKPTSKKL